LLAGEPHPECVAAVEAAARLAESLGHEVVEAEPELDAAELRRAYFAFVASGVSADVHALAARHGRAPRPSDVEPTTWVFKQIGEALRGVDVELARRASRALGYRLADFFTSHDVWLTATCARPPARVGELYPDASKERLMTLLRYVGTRAVLLSSLDKLAAEALAATPNTQIANLAGTPAISLPLHVSSDGLPVGTQWMAPFGREDLLFRLAGQLERARPWSDRRPHLPEVP
jgi:amidase